MAAQLTLLLSQAQIMLMCRERKDSVRLVDHITRALSTVFIRVIFLKSTWNVCHINCVKATLHVGPHLSSLKPALQCGSWHANKCAAFVAYWLVRSASALMHWWYLCSPLCAFQQRQQCKHLSLDPLHASQKCYKISVCGGNFCHLNINTVQNTVHCCSLNSGIE